MISMMLQSVRVSDYHSRWCLSHALVVENSYLTIPMDVGYSPAHKRMQVLGA